MSYSNDSNLNLGSSAAPKVQSYSEAFPGLEGGPTPTQAAVSSFNNPMKSIKSSTTSKKIDIFEKKNTSVKNISNSI